MNNVISQPQTGMRFFTPELYSRINSEDDLISSAARLEWERNEVAYKIELDKILILPDKSVVALASFCLHDCRVLGSSYQARHEAKYTTEGDFADSRRTTSRGMYALEFGRGFHSNRGYLSSLIYRLWAPVTVLEPQEGWLDEGPSQVFWLYDELDLIWLTPRHYIHRILFSDGTVRLIPFRSLLMTDGHVL